MSALIYGKSGGWEETRRRIFRPYRRELSDRSSFKSRREYRDDREISMLLVLFDKIPVLLELQTRVRRM